MPAIVSYPGKLPQGEVLDPIITAMDWFPTVSELCGIFIENGRLTAIVTSTNSIYHNMEKGEAKNLQMVIKDCVPAVSIRNLITPTAPATQSNTTSDSDTHPEK